MEKKIIGIIIIGIIITSGFGSSVAAEKNLLKLPEENDFQNEIADSCLNTVMNFNNETEVSTMGPIAPMLNVAEIIILSGPFIKTMIIKLIISSVRAYFLLPNISFNVRDMTFAVKYRRSIPNLPFINRFSFNTTITENGNENIYTKRHILFVSNFDGKFGFARMSLLQLKPASFIFNGTCDGVLVAT